MALLDKDQYIFLEKKQKEGEEDYYIAEANETMYDVAQKNGVILQNLYDYNNLLLMIILRREQNIFKTAATFGYQ